MSTIVQMTTVPADLIGAQAMHRPKPADKARKPAPANAEDAEDTAEERRLAIREGVAQGVSVYTIQDRSSGRLMLQMARADVEEIAQRPDYSAGQVVDTKI